MTIEANIAKKRNMLTQQQELLAEQIKQTDTLLEEAKKSDITRQRLEEILLEIQMIKRFGESINVSNLDAFINTLKKILRTAFEQDDARKKITKTEEETQRDIDQKIAETQFKSTPIEEVVKPGSGEFTATEIDLRNKELSGYVAFDESTDPGFSYPEKMSSDEYFSSVKPQLICGPQDKKFQKWMEGSRRTDNIRTRVQYAVDYAKNHNMRLANIAYIEWLHRQDQANIPSTLRNADGSLLAPGTISAEKDHKTGKLVVLRSTTYNPTTKEIDDSTFDRQVFNDLQKSPPSYQIILLPNKIPTKKSETSW